MFDQRYISESSFHNPRAPTEELPCGSVMPDWGTKEANAKRKVGRTLKSSRILASIGFDACPRKYHARFAQDFTRKGLKKPFSLSDLAAQVREALDR